MPPQIDVYVTSVLLSAQLRNKHERVQRALVSARVPFSTHDVASSEEAKLEFRRRNRGNNELPCVTVNGEYVGSVEQLDEAVEFGELRQFLRLDESAPTPSAEATQAIPPPPPPPSSEKPTIPNSPKATLDDFASLSLSASELAQLEAELSAGQTLSLPDAPPPQVSSHGHATQVHDVVPLRLHRSDLNAQGERIDYKRVGDYSRPIRQDAATDLQVLDGVEQDELEQLARELEMEERLEKEQRKRISGQETEGPPPPTPPPKDDDDASDPISLVTSAAGSVEGAGGAELSQPIEQIRKLSLTTEQVRDLSQSQDQIPQVITVQHPGQVELAAVQATEFELKKNPTPESSHPAQQLKPVEQRSKKHEVEALKKGLNAGDDKLKFGEIEGDSELGIPTQAVKRNEQEKADLRDDAEAGNENTDLE